jgi:hypothetical protein
MPDKKLKAIDETAVKLGWDQYSWWDIVDGSLKSIAEITGGEIEFVEIRREKGEWKKRLVRGWLSTFRRKEIDLLEEWEEEI